MKIKNSKPLQWNFSHRSLRLQSSVIREILKITMRPEVTSFAGGLPSPTTFPLEKIKIAFDTVLSQHGKIALQYGPTNGYMPLRAWVADSLSTSFSKILPEQVLIVSGSQQGLDLLGKILIDEGSKVVVETPSYLGALQAFSLYGPKFISMPSNEEELISSTIQIVGKNSSLLYALPNFQNPTGRTLSIICRIALVEACTSIGLPLIEDDPYGALSYDNNLLPKMLNMNPNGVIYMGSFSKVLTPGIRLGYVVAPTPLIHKMEQAKQGSDLHTAQLTQMVVYEIIKDGFLQTHIPTICKLYANQCKVMLKALQTYFPVEVTWTQPTGGMFIWVTLPNHIDSSILLNEAVKQLVAFVPGAPFYATSPQTNTLRLSFVTVPPERIQIGIQLLGKLIANKL